MKGRILIVEDDRDIAELERDYLELEGYEVGTVGNGEAAVRKVREEQYALVLLDVMLPGLDGYEVCRRVRKFSDVPIIMVTAKGESIDMIRGLGLGSDDYVVKPFDPAVLVARMKAAIESYRRHKNLGSEIVIGDLRIVPQNYQVFRKGEEVRLANKEFELLRYLAEHPNVVVSRENLFEEVWGMDSLADEATVTVHVNRLREKVGEGVIETVWGAGYRLVKRAS